MCPRASTIAFKLGLMLVITGGRARYGKPAAEHGEGCAAMRQVNNKRARAAEPHALVLEGAPDIQPWMEQIKATPNHKVDNRPFNAAGKASMGLSLKGWRGDPWTPFPLH